MSKSYKAFNMIKWFVLQPRNLNPFGLNLFFSNFHIGSKSVTNWQLKENKCCHGKFWIMVLLGQIRLKSSAPDHSATWSPGNEEIKLFLAKTKGLSLICVGCEFGIEIKKESQRTRERERKEWERWEKEEVCVRKSVCEIFGMENVS